MINIGTLELLKNLTDGLTENEYILLNNETLTSLGPSGPVLPGLPLTQFLSLYFLFYYLTNTLNTKKRE